MRPVVQDSDDMSKTSTSKAPALLTAAAAGKTSSSTPTSMATTTTTTATKEQVSNLIINVSSAFGSRASRGKTIDFKVLIKCTHERFSVLKFPVSMKIKDLKGFLEFVCGIPYNLQRLSYLDDGELVDAKDIDYYDIIDGSLLIMDVWTIYVELVQACVRGTIDHVLKQGVSTKIEWTSPTADYMLSRHKQRYLQDRGGIALFIAAHRGNLPLVKELLAHGASVNYSSAFGRTPIMVSIVANRPTVIDYLLEHHSNIDLCDINGDSALTIAKKFNNKLGQYKLTQYNWKKRTQAEINSKKQANEADEDANDPVFNETRLAHQIYDSSKKTWLKGSLMQVYMMHLVPDNEFSGSRLDAPKSVGKEVLKKHLRARPTTVQRLKTFASDGDEAASVTTTELLPIDSGLTFEKWLAAKLKAKQLLEQKKRKKSERQASLERFVKILFFLYFGDPFLI